MSQLTLTLTPANGVDTAPETVTKKPQVKKVVAKISTSKPVTKKPQVKKTTVQVAKKPVIIEGTVHQLLLDGVCINGRIISQPVISLFCGYGLIQAVGKVKRIAGESGGPATIYRLQESEGFKLSDNPGSVANCKKI